MAGKPIHKLPNLYHFMSILYSKRKSNKNGNPQYLIQNNLNDKQLEQLKTFLKYKLVTKDPLIIQSKDTWTILNIKVTDYDIKKPLKIIEIISQIEFNTFTKKYSYINEEEIVIDNLAQQEATFRLFLKHPKKAEQFINTIKFGITI